MTVRIAMWSGPRNISTAMMRSFENRPDCTVIDEPFYACYLKATAIDHPLAADVIASQSTDWREVSHRLSEAACATPVFYQKHMTHHMLPDMALDWTQQLRHCFLVRHPRYVVNSYVKKRETVTPADIGTGRQLELYETISDITGQVIPVIDAVEFLRAPETILKKLCRHLDIPFCPEMLSWPAGRRDTDGVWASHWYQKVEASTTFEQFSEPDIELSEEQLQVVEESVAAYQQLYKNNRISAA